MVQIENLIKKGTVSRINELELPRYVNFFENSYKNNIEHCKAVIKTFPRWSIISGYYAMHDITKLLLAKQYLLKIEFKVHETTIKLLKELIKNKELTKLAEKGYKEFLTLANDLAEAKKDRVKAQYYTGTAYMKQEHEKRAQEFLEETVKPYLHKILKLTGEKK
ncbi:MAG: hypothetical protein V1914_02430 [archaeon]